MDDWSYIEPSLQAVQNPCPQLLLFFYHEANFAKKFPNIRIITAFVDEGLNEKNYIVPGLGDFGDRFYTL